MDQRWRLLLTLPRAVWDYLTVDHHLKPNRMEEVICGQIKDTKMIRIQVGEHYAVIES